jgi:hypothetical protein
VGGHESRRWQDGAIVALTQEFVIQMPREQLLDQLRPGTTASAMTHVDMAVLEIEGADIGLAGHSGESYHSLKFLKILP